MKNGLFFIYCVTGKVLFNERYNLMKGIIFVSVFDLFF
jgi:hypothetical protein